MRGNHIRIGRNDFVELPRITTEQRALVESVTVTNAEGFKTWKAVHRDNAFLGMVRTKICGTQNYIVGNSIEVMYAGYLQSEYDPQHSLAILALLEATN